VVNNVSYRYSINELAALVQSSARDRQFQVAVSRNWNPRQEDCAGIPEYSVLTDTLRQYITPAPLTESIYQAFDRLMPYRDRIRPGILEPSYDWRMDGGGM
jgi:hypothetical protein